MEAEHVHGQGRDATMSSVQEANTSEATAAQEGPRQGMGQAQKVNANAPVKQMTMELVPTKEAAMIVAPDGSTVLGPRVMASGKCPGRACGASVGSVDPKLLHQLAQCQSGQGPAVLLTKAQCTPCGQRFEAWPRRLMVAR